MRAMWLASVVSMLFLGGVWYVAHEKRRDQTAAREATAFAAWQAGEPKRLADLAARKAIADKAAADLAATQETNWQRQRARQRAYERTHFGGYACKSDCSGHRAGYAWAERNEIEDDRDCEGNSQSFIQGCFVWVQEVVDVQEEEQDRQNGRDRARYVETLEDCDTENDTSNEACREEFDSNN
jgi:hypothetical protein